MAYKNVHKIIQRLLELKLLVKAKKPRSYDNDHNAKFYKLSEGGIFRLFLTRHEGILVDGLSTMSIEHPTIKMDNESIRFCGDCLLFKTFLFPLMDPKHLLLLSDGLLLTIYEYLHLCCGIIERILQTVDQSNLVRSNLCSWNAILNVKNTWDRIELFLSLREKLSLEHVNIDECIDRTNIEINRKRKDEIEISNPQFRIRFRLDRIKKNAIATLLDSHIEYEYEIEELGSDIIILHVESQINWEIGNEFCKRNPFDSLVREIVPILGKVGIVDNKAGLMELSKDKKFMNLVDDAYMEFKRGRSALLEAAT